MEEAKQNTHLKTDELLVGKLSTLNSDQYAEVTLTTTWQMAVDEKGLVHGGFTFGLADYTAMLAVNHPNVVLVGANVQYIAPVQVGDRLISKASIIEKSGNKRTVKVQVYVGEEHVFQGTFSCVITRKYILSMKKE